MALKEKIHRREVLEKALTAVLLIGGVRQIVFQYVRAAVASSESGDSAEAGEDSVSAQVVTVEVPAPPVTQSPASSEFDSPDLEALQNNLSQKLFPEKIGDPQISKVSFINKGPNHGLNMDEKSYQALDQVATQYAQRFASQGKPWRPIEINIVDSVDSVPGAVVPMYVPEFFVTYDDGQRGDVGAQKFGVRSIQTESGKIIATVGFNQNFDEIISGPLFLASPAVGDDNQTFINYRQSKINSQILGMIGALIETNEPDSARWPKEEGRLKLDPELDSVFSRLTLQIS